MSYLSFTTLIASINFEFMLDKSLEDPNLIKNLEEEYKFGFVSNVEQDILPEGLSEEVVRTISAKKEEPEWLLKWRLKAFRLLQKRAYPIWANIKYPPIDFQKISYYAAPKQKLNSLDELDPEILETYQKLGIPLQEQKMLAGVAVDAVFDSVSVVTTFKQKLAEMGIIFCSISEAAKTHPDLVKKYLGSVVPPNDNYFACLNSAVFTDGSFVFVPKGVRCPMEVSTYFRINAENTGQFERTLIIVEEDGYVSYLEGCTSPIRDTNQLHAAVVELIAHKNAQIRYATVQNWYPGDRENKGGIYNFVTKRGLAAEEGARISWTQVETGSAITWKYPSVILRGDNTVGEFYSITVTKKRQQADTGTKMIHLGKNSRSRIISKTISAGQSTNNYRGLVKVDKRAKGAKNYSACDSLLFGNQCSANTFPCLESQTSHCTIEHEASTSKVNEDILFYCRQRGMSHEEATSIIINGFTKEVIQKLPMEFAVEASKLLQITLEGSVG